MIGIYKITSPSGKIYIGQSTNIEKRWKEYYKLRCKTQPKLYHSFLKYGSEKHVYEILEECLVENLDDREIYYGILYDVLVKGLNCCLGHQKQIRSEEVYKKISVANKGRVAWNKGIVGVQTHSEETKKRLKEIKTGTTHSEETRKKISQAHKTSGHHPESRKGKKKVAK